MAVRIRLARRGRKKLAMFDVVVADSRSPRDGKFIAKVGTYNPHTVPATIELDEDKALDWVLKGAQPSDTVRAMLQYKGVMFRKHLQIGVNKGAITQDQADARYTEWKAEKDAKIAGRKENLEKEAAEARKAKLAAEAKVKEARSEALRKKAEEALAAVKAAEAEAAGDDADTNPDENTEA